MRLCTYKILFTIGVITQLLLISCDNKAKLTEKAIKYYFEKKYDSSLVIINQVLSEDSTYNEAIFLKTKIYTKIEEYELSILELNKLKNSTEYKDSSIIHIGQNYFKLANQYWFRDNNIDKRNQYYDSCILYHNTILSSNKLSLESYITLSKLHINKGEVYDAMKICNEGLKKFPKNKKLLFHQVLCNFSSKNYKQCAVDLKELVKENVDDSLLYSDIYCNLSICYYNLHDINNAFESVNKSLLYNPNNKYSYNERAVLYLYKGLKTEACSDFNKSYSLGNFAAKGDIDENCRAPLFNQNNILPDSFGVEIVHVGGIGSKSYSVEAFYLAERGYLDNPKEIIDVFFNAYGDLMNISPPQSHSFSTVSYYTNNKLVKQQACEPDFCQLEIEDKTQNKYILILRKNKN